MGENWKNWGRENTEYGSSAWFFFSQFNAAEREPRDLASSNRKKTALVSMSAAELILLFSFCSWSQYVRTNIRVRVNSQQTPKMKNKEIKMCGKTKQKEKEKKTHAGEV